MLSWYASHMESLGYAWNGEGYGPSLTSVTFERPLSKDTALRMWSSEVMTALTTDRMRLGAGMDGMPPPAQDGLRYRGTRGRNQNAGAHAVRDLMASIRYRLSPDRMNEQEVRHAPPSLPLGLAPKDRLQVVAGTRFIQSQQ